MIKNILITSAGRRVSLVKNFQETLKRFNKDGKVYAVDLNPSLSPACRVADESMEVPRVTDINYINTLLNICKKESISIVIPTIDTELSILAKAKELFLNNGILIAISSKEICDIFYLKDSTEIFFNDKGFLTPKSIPNSDLDSAKYPLFAKLNNSSCSIGAKRVDSSIEARELLASNDKYIFQEFIEAREFTVDVFVDRFQNIISIVPRERLEVRAGEVSKALAIKDEVIESKIDDLVRELKGAYGTLTIQLFKRDNEIFFIEINPRFGGGYPLSYLAGANFAEFLILDYLGENQKYNNSWRDRTLMLRYDSEVIINSFGN